MRRRSLLIGAATAAALAAAAPASAHIQVSPTVAAPADPILVQLLVPNESDASTTEVSLKVPAGVLPFSFEATPGWTRTVKNAANGAPDVIVWKGKLAEDGFARFAFLASTPEKAGAISWKAVQHYSDGKDVRWIGGPESENPAAVTEVRADAPRQNAGGEGAEKRAQSGAATTAAEPAAAADESPSDDEDSGGGSNTLGVILGGAGLLLGATALLVALSVRRRPAPPSPAGDGEQP